MGSGAENDENRMECDGTPQVRNSFGEAGSDGKRGLCIGVLRQMRRKVGEILSESRIAKDKRADVEKEIGEAIRVVETSLMGVELSTGLSQELVAGIVAVLSQRGIESAEEWATYVRTMERDGELLSEICDMMNTDVFLLKSDVAKLQEAARKSHEGPGRVFTSPMTCIDQSQNQLLQERAYLTGRRYAEPSRSRAGTPETTIPAVDDAGTLVTYLRSMACVSPGVFRGERKENFHEFIRRFKRKYESVISCEATLLDILVDDHLSGRAKNMFIALPREVKERGFESVVSEMSKLLAEDSTAGRLRALAELRNLTMRPNQEVAEFCTVLEKLGREANPGCSVEDRSLEYAQILLDNLCSWPEHCQLVAAVHRMEPKKVYEEVKHLAMSIEQSRRMVGAHLRKSSGVGWKNRASWYQEDRDGRSGGLGDTPSRSSRTTHANASGGSMIRGAKEAEPSLRERSVPSGQNEGERPRSGATCNMNRKCYNCAKYGHIGRECPQRLARVNQIVGDPKTQPKKEAESLADIIERVRSLGVRDERDSPLDELVGERMSAPAKVLGSRIEALLDTGSMISIVPVEVLARAKDKGYDIDSLKFLNKSKLTSVHDASGNRMDFLGAVYLDVELEGGGASTVAFHISVSKEEELIIGTNALRRLGVEVSVKRALAEGEKTEWL